MKIKYLKKYFKRTLKTWDWTRAQEKQIPMNQMKNKIGISQFLSVRLEKRQRGDTCDNYWTRHL